MKIKSNIFKGLIIIACMQVGGIASANTAPSNTDTTGKVKETDPPRELSALQKQAIADYKILYAPPDGGKAEDTWAVDFGPTEAEAKKDKVKQAKRDYVMKYMPEHKIQGKREERKVIWNK